MDALILSCSTGGGHNAAGYALKEELECRGHNATMFDPYVLAGSELDQKIGNLYVKLVQRAPRMFGFLYWLGQVYRRLPWHSPVYYANRKTARLLEAHLEKHHYDVILMPHLYPAEMLTYLKNQGVKLPKTIFVATDYTCIPFTEEISMDYYITPTDKLTEDFVSRGVDPSLIRPLGIPVKKAFHDQSTREEAIRKLQLDSTRHYILVCGGSMGAGKITRTVYALRKILKGSPDRVLIVICGGNKRLYRKLRSKCKAYTSRVILMQSTDQIADYMRASDLYICKPGGLSSTEAAVMGVPLIHVTPIPGCETRNIRFFDRLGLSIGIGNHIRKLPKALRKTEDEAFKAQMRAAQQREINPLAASDIVDLAETLQY